MSIVIMFWETYGLSGIRTIKDNNIDLNNNKNIIILASILTIGVSGAVCDFGIISFGTTALAMIIGIILNLILKDDEVNCECN